VKMTVTSCSAEGESASRLAVTLLRVMHKRGDFMRLHAGRNIMPGT
jgi:hypothetical protein